MSLINSTIIFNKILSYTLDNKTILNLRLVSKAVYNLMSIFRLYHRLSKITFYFKNNQCLKSEYYIYSLVCKNYCLYELVMYNFKRNGKSYTLYNDGSILKSNFYLNGSKHGIEKMYGIQKYLCSTTNYRMGQKSGVSSIIDSNNTLLFFFERDEIKTFSKLTDNKIMYKCIFNNKYLEGKVNLYDNIFRESNFYLNFKKNKLEGQSILLQYDRKLILNFSSGQLEGTQTIINNDNKLEMICNFKNGLMYGPYQIWRQNTIVEKGYCHNIPNLYSNISIFDNGVKYYYPLSYNGLNGVYTEKSLNEEYSITFESNVFFGLYTRKYNNIKIQKKIYNSNNFIYTKCRSFYSG